jgi:phosphoglycolate phosphatase-like HAD superfamily hydrolase
MAPRPIHEYERVLFDCDDTILQTSKTRWNVMIQSATEFGCFDLDDRRIRQVWGQPFTTMISEPAPRHRLPQVRVPVP